ncbi:MAG: hypothetical protein ABI434_17110 [Burkholderiaceae bacterium]
MINKAKKVSSVLLDFVFGEPVPQLEVTLQDTEHAWQDWLEATAERANDADDTDSFGRTVPMMMH